jgi:hypothetical protein
VIAAGGRREIACAEFSLKKQVEFVRAWCLVEETGARCVIEPVTALLIPAHPMPERAAVT